MIRVLLFLVGLLTCGAAQAQQQGGGPVRNVGCPPVVCVYSTAVYAGSGSAPPASGTGTSGTTGATANAAGYVLAYKSGGIPYFRGVRTETGISSATNLTTFQGAAFNSANSQVVFGAVQVQGTNFTSGSESAQINMNVMSTGTNAVYSITPSGLKLPKLSTDPATAPGAGNAFIYIKAGTTGGTCALRMMAGTSTTASTVLDNVGTGC